jgi:glycosyltransferase involved in cell wall biosynthesis
MIKRKGILTAALTCNALNKKLIIAGQGAHVREDGYLIPNDSPDFALAPGTWEYIGFVDIPERKKWMSGAIATFTPTEYLECFAGTHVESMLHGTPPITTNFAVFPGTIPDCVDGKVGFRCNTLDDFVKAARAARHVNRHEVRQYGERFLMDQVKLDFQKWFEDLHRVWRSATIPHAKGWHYIEEV